MNYRHAFHAGNFADVMKHAALADVITYLKAKDKPFRVIDTHAGRGRYRLHGPSPEAADAARTGEWQDGIGRVLASAETNAAGASPPHLQPYLDAIAACQPNRPVGLATHSSNDLEVYPGSPLVAASLMREQDRLHANEKNEDEARVLARVLAGDRRARVTTNDGWQELRASLPPPERRGIILIDPPFEEPGELQRLHDGLRDVLARFAGGIVLLWYPIKDRRPIEKLYRQVEAIGSCEILACELIIRNDRVIDRLNGCGLIVANPPYGFRERYQRVLTWFAQVLGQDRHARADVRDLSAAAERTSDSSKDPRPRPPRSEVRKVKYKRSRSIRRT